MAWWLRKNLNEIIFVLGHLGKPQKKPYFFSGPATKAFTPPTPPLGLVAIRNFFPYIKKKFFFP